MTVKSVDLFTKEEHAVIAGWLNIENAGAIIHH